MEGKQPSETVHFEDLPEKVKELMEKFDPKSPIRANYDRLKGGGGHR